MDKKMIRMMVWMVGMILLFGTAAQAQGWDGKGGKRSGAFAKEREERFQKMAAELNLTEEQKQRIEAQKKEHREQFQKLREELRRKKDELRSELQKPQLDMDKIQQIHGQIKALLAQKEDQRLQGILQMREILTPEQFTQFHQRMEEGRRKMRGEHF